MRAKNISFDFLVCCFFIPKQTDWDRKINKGQMKTSWNENDRKQFICDERWFCIECVCVCGLMLIYGGVESEYERVNELA